MSPLDHTTPEALFGDAVHDRRALRKAYARLIKRFSPDQHPEAFEHVRRLYEQARQDVGAHRVPDPSPKTTRDEGFSLDAWLGGLTAERYEVALDGLRDHVTRTGDEDAAAVLFACVDGTNPGEVPPLLAELCRHPGLQDMCVHLAWDALTTRPELIAEPSWSRVSAQLEDAGHVSSLAMARIVAHERLDQPAAVVAVFREVEPVLRTRDPRGHAMVVLRVVRSGGFQLDATLLDIVENTLSHYDFAAHEDEVEAALQHHRFLRAWRAAHADLEVPPELLTALRLGADLSGLSAVVVLRDLGEQLPGPRLATMTAHLKHHWPQLLAHLDQLVCRATLRPEWLAAFRSAGRPPVADGEVREAQLPGLVAGLADRPAEDGPAEWSTSDWMSRAVVLGLVALWVVSGVWKVATDLRLDVEPATLAAVSLGLTAVLWIPAWIWISKVIQRNADRRVRAQVERDRGAELVPVLHRDRVEMGLWAHDVAGLVSTLAPRRFDTVVEAMMQDRVVDIRDIRDAHFRTALQRTHSDEDSAEESGR